MVRAAASDAAENLKKQATAAAQQAADAASNAANKAADAASKAAGKAADAVKNFQVPDMAQLDVNIKQTVSWNFLVQLALTAVSWGIAFFTSHASMAKVRRSHSIVSAASTAHRQLGRTCMHAPVTSVHPCRAYRQRTRAALPLRTRPPRAALFAAAWLLLAQGAGVHPTTALLMIGVLLSGYSAYLSYTYVVKLKDGGLDMLQGWAQMKAFYDHLTINFAGAAATILALQVLWAASRALQACGCTRAPALSRRCDTG